MSSAGRTHDDDFRPAGIAGAEGWALRRDEGAASFHSRLTWEMPSGGEAVWDSRSARKRGVLWLRDEAGGGLRRAVADPGVARRLARINLVAAIAFTIGGSLFAIGALVSQIGSGDALTAASIYLAGGVFFSVGGYASVMQAVNAPRRVRPDGSLIDEGRRWWAYEPERIDWLSAFVLFCGTLAFGISLIDAFLEGLTARQQDALIWSPEMVGCILFLVSGHLAWAEVCHRMRPCFRRRDLSWAIVAINQLGSVLFFAAGLAGFIRPETTSAVDLAIANWGTFAGAVCFAAGGVMQAFERPGRPDKGQT